MSLRRTPCIGICSTTYGDLVCRGCKRFAHEIVHWNGFAADQQEAVRQRLQTLRDGATGAFLEVVDEPALRVAAARLGVADTVECAPLELGYRILQQLHRASRARASGARSPQASVMPGGAAALVERAAAEPDPAGLETLGLRPIGAVEPGQPPDALASRLLVRIDQEFYRRSLAQYERNFRILAE